MDNEKLIVVLSTVGTAAEAESIATTLVNERLAACVNIIPQIRSIYRWQDSIEDDSELLLLIKTKSSGFSSLEKRLSQLHSYSTPEIVALDSCAVSKSYMSWMLKQVE